jgi:nucleoside phosphorylase
VSVSPSIDNLRLLLSDAMPNADEQIIEQTLALARHAALPAALNTALVHLLRINFLPETAHAAEYNLLLSPLCRVIGDDLYEITPELRGALLYDLAKVHGPARVRNVARLLGQYTHRPGAPWGEDTPLERAQRLTALNFIDPTIAKEWMEHAEQRLGTGTSLDRAWFVAMRNEVTQIEQFVTISPSDSQPGFTGADILLVTVTAVEMRAVLDVLRTQFNRTIKRHNVGDKTYYDLGNIGGAAVAMVQSEIGAGGPGAALLTVQKSIDALNPVAVIMVGMALGLDSRKQHVGDVLVARQLALYELQRVGQSAAGAPQLRVRGDRPAVSPWLLDKFRSGVLDWRQPGGAALAEVHFGLVFSGEKLIDHQDFRNQLRMVEPEAIGVEMEGAGLYMAAIDRRIDWILVKAICDWGDGNKSRNKQQRQRLAAQNAAEFVFHVLKLGGVAQLRTVLQDIMPARKISNAPPLPSLMVSREDDMRQVKARLGVGIQDVHTMHVLTVIRGWPGVGKTTLVSALAHDPDVAATFPDGVLWASLGQEPNLLAELAAWGRALSIPNLAQARTTEEVSAQLRAVLRIKRMLLIVDDVWDARHTELFRVGGPGCALLVTTRLPGVARTIAPTPGDVYILGVLSDEKALELLQTLAPDAVREHPAVCQELVDDLEGLPLAIQVAGRLLQTEHSYGFSVVTLLEDIRAGARLIQEQAPVDRTEVANDTTPTIAALLNKSTALLDDETRNYFAYLGAFAPEPATFDADAMRDVWQVEDPKPIIRKLVDYGLLESVENGRFWMQKMLVAHAMSFLTDD